MPVVVLDDLSTGTRANLAGVDVEFVEGSILDPVSLTRVCQSATSVVHLAARPSVPRSLHDPIATHEVNVTGTLRVLEAARTVSAQMIVASSSSVYGANADMPKRESSLPAPVSPYAVSKLAAEGYALAYLRCFALPILVFRFFNVFGPLQTADHAYAAAVPRFIDAALTGRPLEVYGDGKQTRDFTYVGTVAQVVAQAVARRVVYDGPINLAFGSRTSLLDVIEQIGSLAGRSAEIRYLQPRLGDVRDSQADSSLLRSMFPDVVPIGLSEGLRATVEWFRFPRQDPTTAAIPSVR